MGGGAGSRSNLKLGSRTLKIVKCLHGFHNSKALTEINSELKIKNNRVNHSGCKAENQTELNNTR